MVNEICNCGHHTNHHSYPYPETGSMNLECDKCDCKNFIETTMEVKMEEQKPEIQEKVSYDDRRKELIHNTTEKVKNEFGVLNIETHAVIHEEGIRNTVNDLNQRQKSLKESIIILNKLQAPTPEMDSELSDLKDKLEILQKINHDKNLTEEKEKKEKDDLKNAEEELKKVTRDLNQIKNTIGSRLKF